MVHFLVGTAGVGKTALLTEKIVNEISCGSRDVVLIVPEQQAVAWETKMSALLPVSANLRLEITNFTRLSNAVFREYGGLSDTVVDEGSRALLVWRAMLEMRETLSVFSSLSAGHEDKAIPTLTKAIDELKQSGISPKEAEVALDALKRDADETQSGLISRLSDAVQVYAAYNALLHETFIDRGDVLSLLADTLSRHPYFKGKAVFIDSFFSMTAPEERILSLIMRQADEVTVTFACPPHTSPRSGEIPFREIETYYRRTLSLANRVGVEVETVPLTENKRHKAGGELFTLEQKLFSNAFLPDFSGEKTESEAVRIIRCADRYEESEACASVIKKLLTEGYRYSDIAVVAHDMSERQGILDSTLRRHGIRCFLSESTEVSSSPAVQLVSAALSVVAGGWQRKDVIRLIKTGLVPPADTADTLAALDLNLFETYTYTWNIHGKRMFCAEKWTMNPEGYREELSETGAQILAAVNTAKERIIPPLEKFLSVFGDGRGVVSVREIAERIYFFAEDYAILPSLTALAEKYDSVGLPRDAERVRKSWDYVVEILDKMVRILGDMPLNAVRFARLFATLAADMDKGTIPTGIDEVVLGSASGVRFDEVKCVILIGSVEGEFPRPVSDAAGFFDDRDKVALESVGLEISTPDAALALAREYFMYYRTVASATEKLRILAPTGNGDALSDGAAQVDAILSSLGKNAVSSFGRMPLSELVYDRESALYLLARRTDSDEIALLRSLVGEVGDSAIPMTAASDTLFPDRLQSSRIVLSQSAISTFVKCPFLYTCRDKVKVSPDNKAELKLNSIGSFIHRVFERFFTEVPQEKILAGLTKDEMYEAADAIIREYMDSLAHSAGRRDGDYDGRLSYLLLRLRRYLLVFLEAMTDELKQSAFTPVALEQPIGMESADKPSLPSISFETADGATVSLRGIADRIDVYDAPDGKRYLRVVDYKTGAKEFSLDDVRAGLDVQLLLYLFSVWKFGLPHLQARETVPAAAIYFTAIPKTTTSNTLTETEETRQKSVDSVKRSGVFLDDADVLRAMEAGLDGKYVPLTLSEKDGSLKGSKSACVLSLEEFGQLYHELGDIIGNIADEMRKGKAEAKPRGYGNDSPCRFCDYAYICKNAKGGRNA